MLLMMMGGFCVGGSVDGRWLGCSARAKDITSTPLRHQEKKKKEEEYSMLLHIGEKSGFIPVSSPYNRNDLVYISTLNHTDYACCRLFLPLKILVLYL